QGQVIVPGKVVGPDLTLVLCSEVVVCRQRREQSLRSDTVALDVLELGHISAKSIVKRLGRLAAADYGSVYVLGPRTGPHRRGRDHTAAAGHPKRSQMRANQVTAASYSFGSAANAMSPVTTTPVAIPISERMALRSSSSSLRTSVSTS